MRKLFLTLLSGLLAASLIAPGTTSAAGGIFPSGGGTFQVGQTFTITVRASGATFDSLQGKISVSGPASIVSFSAGSATWLPGKAPSNGNQFVGITSATSSLTVASIKLRGTGEGKGSVSVSGVRLARSGSEVGNSGGTTSFTINRAPTPPGGVPVTSATHPNQEETYDATTAELAWSAPANGATGYSYLLDQAADTNPPETVTSADTSAKYENLTVGTHYFHIRARNSDGWSGPTHFRINIKPRVDEALEVPAVTSIALMDNYQNDIEQGTLTGILLHGTGPAGYKINLVFTPDLGLPKTVEQPPATPEAPAPPPVEKYPAPVADEQGKWSFAISDPVKSGFYKLTVQAQNEATVSKISGETKFEVSIKNGGSINLVSAEDTTDAYKQLEDGKVAAANKRKVAAISSGAVFIVLLAASLFLLRRKLHRLGR